MNRAELLEQKRDEILRLAAVHGVRDIRVFGSVARGDDQEDSDVDFLVELEEGRTLFDLGGLLMDLREILNCGVDIVTTGSLGPSSRDTVLKEARAL